MLHNEQLAWIPEEAENNTSVRLAVTVFTAMAVSSSTASSTVVSLQ